MEEARGHNMRFCTSWDFSKCLSDIVMLMNLNILTLAIQSIVAKRVVEIIFPNIRKAQDIILNFKFDKR